MMFGYSWSEWLLGVFLLIIWCGATICLAILLKQRQADKRREQEWQEQKQIIFKQVEEHRRTSENIGEHRRLHEPF